MKHRVNLAVTLTADMRAHHRLRAVIQKFARDTAKVDERNTPP
jgi:hypothetical protein